MGECEGGVSYEGTNAESAGQLVAKTPSAKGLQGDLDMYKEREGRGATERDRTSEDKD